MTILGWSFAVVGWALLLFVSGAHIQMRDSVLAELRRRHERWAKVRTLYAGTTDGAYAEGYSAGLREAELLVEREMTNAGPPRGSGPRMAAA